jgi:hypothetical protein
MRNRREHIGMARATHLYCDFFVRFRMSFFWNLFFHCSCERLFLFPKITWSKQIHVHLGWQAEFTDENKVVSSVPLYASTGRILLYYWCQYRYSWTFAVNVRSSDPFFFFFFLKVVSKILQIWRRVFMMIYRSLLTLIREKLFRGNFYWVS